MTINEPTKKELYRLLDNIIQDAVYLKKELKDDEHDVDTFNFMLEGIVDFATEAYTKWADSIPEEEWEL